jgi:F-type H+-transporting ATPase subunit alpha
MGISLFAANEGYIEDIDVKKIGDFESALLAYMKSQHADLMKQVNESGDWNSDIEAGFRGALEKYKSTQTW